jgi:hypothetical protein
LHVSARFLKNLVVFLHHSWFENVLSVKISYCYLPYKQRKKF